MSISKSIAQLYRPISALFRKLSPSERRFQRRMAAYAEAYQLPAAGVCPALQQPSSSEMRDHELRSATPQSDPHSLGLGEEDVLAFRASEFLRYSEFLSDEEIAEKHGRTPDEIAALKAQALEARAV